MPFAGGEVTGMVGVELEQLLGSPRVVHVGQELAAKLSLLRSGMPLTWPRTC